MEPSRFLNKNDIKLALKSDARFRELFPEFKSEIAEYLSNPSCPCHEPLLVKIMLERDRLKKYFPNKELLAMPEKEKFTELWHVINCHVDDLDAQLRKLPPVRKQISMSRYEDQVTVIVNMLLVNG